MMRLALLPIIAAVGACAGVVAPAEMVLPPALSDQQPIAIRGIGGFRTGDFSFEGRQVTFRRSSSSTSLGGVFENRDGMINATLLGPGGRLAIDCRVRERNFAFSSIGFNVTPMALACAFSDLGLSLEVVGERRGLDTVLAPQRRAGELRYPGGVIDIRSVHTLKGSALPLDVPIGYVLTRGREDLAAIELNGTPRLFLADDLSAEDRRLVDAVVTVLVVFWDPASTSP